MTYRLLVFIGLSCSVQALQAQQSPLFGRYAPLTLNPASAAADQISSVMLRQRQQWFQIEGAPSSTLIEGHYALKNDRVGLGASFINDRAGALSTTQLGLAYAYGLPLSESVSLRGGLQVALDNWRSDWSELTLANEQDPVYLQNINRWTPNVGAGMQLYSPHFELGFGMPRFFENDLNNAVDENALNAQTWRLYTARIAGRIFVGENGLFVSPSLTGRSTGFMRILRKKPHENVTAPDHLDFGIDMGWKYGILAGISWRTALQRGISSDDALGLRIAWKLPKSRFSVMTQYDLSLSTLQRASAGSFELGAQYAFERKIDDLVRIIPPIIRMEEEDVPEQTPDSPPSKPEQTTPQRYEVRGLVIGMRDGLPAENARLTMSNDCHSAIPDAVITGPDGRFSFAAQADCCYVITVKKDGFKPAIIEQICLKTGPQGEIRHLNIELNPQ